MQYWVAIGECFWFDWEGLIPGWVKNQLLAEPYCQWPGYRTTSFKDLLAWICTVKIHTIFPSKDIKVCELGRQGSVITIFIDLSGEGFTHPEAQNLGFLDAFSRPTESLVSRLYLSMWLIGVDSSILFQLHAGINNYPRGIWASEFQAVFLFLSSRWNPQTHVSQSGSYSFRTLDSTCFH